MGLFDSLKDIARNSANSALNNIKQDAKNEINDNIREKSVQTFTDGIKSYLNDAQNKVTTEDGKEAVSLLQNLVDDAENAHKSAVSVEDDNTEVYTKKAQEDLQKLSDLAEKYDNKQ